MSSKGAEGNQKEKAFFSIFCFVKAPGKKAAVARLARRQPLCGVRRQFLFSSRVRMKCNANRRDEEGAGVGTRVIKRARATAVCATRRTASSRSRRNFCEFRSALLSTCSHLLAARPDSPLTTSLEFATSISVAASALRPLVVIELVLLASSPAPGSIDPVRDSSGTNPTRCFSMTGPTAAAAALPGC